MTAIELIFDNIGRAITSMAAVIFVLLMTITGMIFFSHTLFIEVFPDSMVAWEKLLATWVMALGWEFTVLITTCNTRHINKHIPVIMAIASGIIVLFFIQAFDGSREPLLIAQRWFVGLLAATINYIYAELFYAKWKERADQKEFPIRLDETVKQLDEARRSLGETGSMLAERDRELAELRSTVNDLERFRTRIQRELTCPHCKVIQETWGILQAHKGHCEHNPNKRGSSKQQ